MRVTELYSSGPCKPLFKQHAILGSDGASSWPLVYFQRPKWIKDDKAWERIVSSIRLELPSGFIIK